MNGSDVLALDVGGTNMSAGVVDAEAQLLSRATAPTPTDADAESLFESAVFVIEAALSDTVDPPRALGVGCGGPMLWPSGDVSPLNIPGWRGFPLRDRLSERFGIPVRIHNDAICLTIGEHLAGAGQGLHNLLGMVVSTGVGGGFVLGGRLQDGTSGNAGHIGHVVVDPDGPDCTCGGRGCLESIARGPALVGWALDQGWQPAAGVTKPSAKDLADSARAGDGLALAAFSRGGNAVGIAIASSAALLDLEVVAVGGGVSLAGDLVLDALYRAFEIHAGLDFVRRCRIVLAGEDSSLLGAAGLFLAEDRYWHGD